MAVQIGRDHRECLLHIPDGQFEWTTPASQEQGEWGNTSQVPNDSPAATTPLSFRVVARTELDAYRNLAANPYDLCESANAFPHASANCESPAAPHEAARTAIDCNNTAEPSTGWKSATSHDADSNRPWWQVDFGGSVQVDKVVITLRSDGNDGAYWRKATLVFSDGQRQTIELKKTNAPQPFTFDVRRTTSVRLTDLVSGSLPTSCVLVECEVWGRDRIRFNENLSAIGP